MSTTKLILPSGEIIESDNPENLRGFIGRIGQTLRSSATEAEPVAKRKYTKSNLRHSRWSGEEIELVAQNLTRSTRELMQMLPTRTSKAIIAVKGQLRNNKLTPAKQKIYADYLNHRS